jgi:hypothetical protein
MPVGGVFAASLTGLSGQQVLEETEHLLDPVALIPSPNQPLTFILVRLDS